MSKQVVLITGCSSGIGRSLAEEARGRGHTVYATARRVETLQALEQAGARALELDITDPVSVRHAVATMANEVGRVDMLINNAGQSLFGPLAELPLDKVSKLFNTNLISQLAMCQAVIPLMVATGSGCIVNVGSMVGVVTTPFAGAYSATKAALHLLSEALRMEVAPLGIDVVVIQPGGVQSKVAETAKAHSDLERYRQKSSLYHSVYSQIQRRANASQDGPMPADIFARKVWDQLSRSPLPDVIRVGRGVGVLRTLSILPRAVRDVVFTRYSGLDKLSVR